MKKNKLPVICAITLLLFSNIIVAKSHQNTIKVTGVAKIVVESNQGEISASIITKSLSADDAINQNGVITQVVINELNAVGIDGSNIQTSGFSFSPNYKWNDGEYIFDGYSVSNGLLITVEDNNTIGPVVDLLVEAGVTRINSVAFISINMEAIRSQAMIAATTDARNKATILAEASAVGLGNAVSIISSSSNGSVSSSLNPSTSVGAVIIPGTNNINASVTIEYLIN